MAGARSLYPLILCLLASCHLVFPHGATSRDGGARDHLGFHEGGQWADAGDLPRADLAGSCLIEGNDYPRQGQKAGDPCRVCDPAFSPAFWAPAPGCLITLPTAAKLDGPHGVAVDGERIYVAAEESRVVWSIDRATGAASVLGEYPMIDGPRGIRLHGNALHVVEAYQHEVSSFDLGSKQLTKSGLFPSIQDPYDLVVDPGGVLHVCDRDTNAIYKGNLSSPLPLAAHDLLKPTALALAGGLLLVGDEERVFSYDLGAGTFKVIAGNRTSCSESLPAVVCLSSAIQGLAIDGQKRILIVDSYHHRVLRVDPGGAGELIAGKTYVAGKVDGKLGVGRLADPAGIAVTGDYAVIADKGNNLIRLLRLP